MLVIDGHNLIGAMRQIKLSDPKAKDKLLKLLENYQKLIGKKITVVFDGKGYGSFEIDRVGEIEIRYPSGKNSADDVIKNLLMNKAHAREMTLISSDQELIQIAKRKHISTQSSKNFAFEMENVLSRISDQKTDDYLSPIDINDWLNFFQKKPPKYKL